MTASSACTPALVLDYIVRPSWCDRSNQLALKTISKEKPDVVVVAQNKSHQISNLQLVGQKAIEAGAKEVLIMGPTPHWEDLLYRLIQRHLWVHTPRRTWLYVSQEFINRNKVLSVNLNFLPHIQYVNVIDLFCDQEGCLTYLGDDREGGLTTFDDSHLSPAASDYLTKKLVVPIILEKSNDKN